MLKHFSKLVPPSSDLWHTLLPAGRVIGLVQVFFGLLMILPAVIGWLTQDASSTRIFAISALATIITGLFLCIGLRHFKRELMPRDGILLVPLTWVWLPLFACIPIAWTLSHIGQPIDFSHAYFEAVSGLTTTGSSVLTHVDDLPIALNFWRTFLQWIGGLGVIILAVAILPLFGVGATQLFKVEMAGPIKDTKLTPRISTTAKVLWGIYVFFSLLCGLAYWLAGMDPLEAIMHMFSTVSLGGLSSHDQSLAYFKSGTIECIAIVFMVLGSCSFPLYFTCIRNRSLKRFWQDPEARSTLILIFGCALFASFWLWVKGTYDGYDAFRKGMFNVISVATTTGFTTADYTSGRWPIFIPVMMLMLSGIATGAGSTGGGIKMIRLLILIKQTKREIRRMIHPRAVQPLTIAKEIIGEPVIFSVLAFMLVYGTVVIFLSMLLLLTDMDIVSAFSAVLASVHCMGVGMGDVGPLSGFAHLSNFQIWICSFAMLLGRLEMLCFLAVLMPSFWRR